MPILQKLRERIPRFGFFTQRFTEAQQRLMMRYKEGLARALGVPVSRIKPGLAERWMAGFVAGVTVPRYQQEIVIEPSY